MTYSGGYSGGYSGSYGGNQPGCLDPVFRLIGKLIKWGVLAAVVVVGLILGWPLVAAAAIGYGLAWWQGWLPRRLFMAGVWALPMFGTFVAAFAVLWATSDDVAAGEKWQGVVFAPVAAYLQALVSMGEGRVLEAAVYVAPSAIPLGLFIAGLVWRGRFAMMESGFVGWDPSVPLRIDYRQWRHASRAAWQRVRTPGGVPLLSRRHNPILGATIRPVRHPRRPLLELGYGLLRTHMLVVGATGAGKSTALVKLWTGFWAAASRRFLDGREYRPWLVVIDAKGGFDSRDTADNARRALRDVGAGRVAIWPDEVSLDLWRLPVGRLSEVLIDLVPLAREGAAAYYSDILAAVVDLAVKAPPGPPRNSREFLARLDAGALELAYAGIPERQSVIQSAAKHVGDVALRYKALFNKLGPAFDGDNLVTDFDVLYCVLEGTASTAVAEAQARALVELVTDAATRWGNLPSHESGNDSAVAEGTEQRAGMLALDEFSAVAGRLRVYEVTERIRSLGMAVQIASPSWEGLADREDERQRIAATATGGVIVMRCPNPEPLVELAGTRKVIEIGHKIIGGGFGDEGTARVQHVWVVDPDRVRNFGVGQAAFILGNGATYLQIAPYRPTPRALTNRLVVPAQPSQPHQPVPPDGPLDPAPRPKPPTRPVKPTRPEPPDSLDDVFGGRP